MKLLVATQKKFILWDGQPHVLFESQHLCYGVSWDYDHIYLGNREEDPSKAIMTFNEHLEHVGYVPFEELGQDTHQLYWHDGILYVANTDQFRIECMDMHTMEQSCVQWTTIDNHINSIWFDGSYFFVAEHRQNRMPKVILLFDRDWNMVGEHKFHLRPQDTITGYGIHNVYMECETLFTLAPSQIYMAHMRGFGNVDYETTHNVVGPAERPYCRGLARSKGAFFVGVSALRARSHRGEGVSYIYVYDNKFRLLDIIHLEDTGQILEIRAVKDDQAHNGVRCPYE